MVKYQEANDKPWAEKQGKLFWRGSTTGGHGRDRSWRRHHRQRLIQIVNAGGQAQALIMEQRTGAESRQPQWEAVQVPRSDYHKLFDVYFTSVVQCEPSDCEEQQQIFGVTERTTQEDAWGFKYLLDMDGNAYSGRFYAFLQSKSLTFKQAIFREWHGEWLKSWVHYVPLSPRGDDLLEAVRFFDDGSGYGGKEAERIAMESRDWASKALRKEDMEAWFFRLLLEYARVIDNKRGSIGFDL